MKLNTSKFLKTVQRLFWLVSLASFFLAACRAISAPGIKPAATQAVLPTQAVRQAGESLPTKTPFSASSRTLPLISSGATSTVPAITQAAEATPGGTSGSENPAPTSQGSQPTLWLAPYLPEPLRASLTLPSQFSLAESPENAFLRLEVGEDHPVSRWVYALVAPFPTIQDGVSIQDLRKSWKGEPQGAFAGSPILVSESTYGVFEALWGTPPDGAVEVLPEDELVSYAWDHQPSWGIVPFEALEPKWKVLEVNGISPLRKSFDLDQYPLAVTFSLDGDQGLAETDLGPDSGQNALGIPTTNRDPGKLTTLVMTGVTALVRATAYTMERNGVTYPAGDIGDLLRSADLTHISNEIPFTPDCPPPNPSQVGLRFCSDPRYIELLDDVGTDIVELTGDHFGDWGPEAMRYTLDLYKQRGWTYYGGGYDLKDGRQARIVEHNGNRLAFIGCNAKGGGYATASESTPGAVACDYDWMHKEIASLEKQGDIVIATFQHFEYYTYYAQPDQIEDFRGMAQAGAAIVSGSQAHQPQGMEFYKGAFIHYGLGNLFFDQYQYCEQFACDDGFIDRHVFYDGRYIGTELITIRFIDFARPRLMTPDERAALLQKVFSASGW